MQDSAREQRSVALGWIATDSLPAHFRLVCNKIMLENPHTFLMKTGSKILTGKVLVDAIIMDNNIILHFIKYVNILKTCRKKKTRSSA